MTRIVAFLTPSIRAFELAALLGLRSSEAVLAVVLAYFPVEQLPVRSRLLLEEMFDDGT